MPKLTDQRLQQAEHILDRYQADLYAKLDYDMDKFENELRSCWNVGYQEIKRMLIDLVEKYPKYKYLALYYMQFQNCDEPVCEFHDTLAMHYGARRYESEDIEQKKETFWENFKRIAKNEK